MSAWRWAGRAVLVLVGVLGAAGCHRTPPAALGQRLVVKIGEVAPLTGPQAHLGKDNDNGARLAVDEANAEGIMIGGRRAHFEIVSEDDQADPRTATIVAQMLVDQHVNGVIGHLNSGTSIPASKIYADAGIPEISPSATAVAYTEQGFATAFRVMANDRQQGHVLGRFAVKDLRAKRVAIIDDRTAYGQGLADQVAKAVTAAGGQVVDREFTTDHSMDFLAILTAIKARNPDLVFYGGMDAQAAPMIRQMHSLGIQVPFLGGDGVRTAEFLRLAGADAEGVIASSPGLPIDTMPGGKAFRAKFNARYGVIQTYAPYAYDATWTMIEAMRQAGSADPARYLPVLAHIHYAGVTGDIAFDAHGDIRSGAITVYRAQHGHWEVLKTFHGAAAGTDRPD